MLPEDDLKVLSPFLSLISTKKGALYPKVIEEVSGINIDPLPTKINKQSPAPSSQRTWKQAAYEKRRKILENKLFTIFKYHRKYSDTNCIPVKKGQVGHLNFYCFDKMS